MTEQRPEKKQRQEHDVTLLNVESKAHRLALETPRPKGKVYAYGTSGFRDVAEVLPSVCLRVGMLAAVRSRALAKDKSCPVVGIVVTASHNEEKDNGVKFVDPNGGMLEGRWEEIATKLANADESKVCEVLKSIGEDEGVDWSLQPRVFIGSDTRPSSPHLVALLKKGLESLGAEVRDYGLTTTPQIHWAVGQANLGREHELSDYYKQISTSFNTLLSDVDKLDPLIVDCANGVGKISVAKFIPLVKDKLPISMINTDEKGLNFEAGAEHVQKTRTVPQNVDRKTDRGKKFASLDGDADRLVYFYLDEEGTVELLDGDKISSLAASLIIRLLNESKIKGLTIGVVQTAYANGASTRYITQDLKVPVEFGCTGVKFIHPKAEEYDVGIYFEANGHGTVLFSENARKAITSATTNSDKLAQKAALQLQALTQLINFAIGDAVSDMLFVEVALALNNWKLKDWAAIYRDYPSTTIKAKVKDRSVIKTTNAERTCTAPQGVQTKIDELVSSILSKARRSFVRPSGTEDVVRVYAEAETQKEADELAALVKEIVLDLAGGIRD